MAIFELAMKLKDFLWDYLLIFLLLGTGIIYCIRLRFPQVRQFKRINKYVFSQVTKKSEGSGGMSSFQALATALAAQVGTGNLAGVATALASGGPGAIFWMWLSAFFGMSTIFGEAVLAQKYVTTIDGEKVGGPAYYIRDGLKDKPVVGKMNKFLAAFFSIAIILALGFVGNMVQSNSIGAAMSTAFNIKPIVGGIVVAVAAGLVFMGGMNRIANITSLLVPFMAVLYIAGSAVILFMYKANIIPAFKLIFTSAFTAKAAFGGVTGYAVKLAVQKGIARGLFSNEAGMGSTPHAHAVAEVDHPAEQGLVAIFGVIFDTLIVCTITALVNIVTDSPSAGFEGIEITQHAYTLALGSLGTKFIAISIFFFAFSTIIGWYYFGESNIKYLFGNKGIVPYRIIVIAFIILGSIVTKADAVWNLADLFNGIMVIPNVIGLLFLSREAKEILVDYEKNYLPNNPDK